MPFVQESCGGDSNRIPFAASNQRISVFGVQQWNEPNPKMRGKLLVIGIDIIDVEVNF
jgi:hypothetical protein